MRRVSWLIGVAAVFLVVTAAITADNPMIVKDDVAVSREEMDVKSPGIPHEISYQGYLEDDGGNPVNGTFTFTFKIFDDSTGGTQLWSDSYSVEVTKGRFSVIPSGIPLSVFTGGTTRYLEVAIESETLSPRTKLTSMGWSYLSEQADNADKVDGHDYSSLWDVYNYDNQPDYGVRGEPTRNEIEGWGGYWTQSDDALYVDNTGWIVGIGTTLPSSDYKLHVIGSSGGDAAVFGEANGATIAIWGKGSSGYLNPAVFGEANGAYHGVLGEGSSGGEAGVFGWANGADYAVLAGGGQIAAVCASNVGTYGVLCDGGTYGIFAGGGTYGVYGSGESYGVYGSSGESYGVYGFGAFYGVYASGDLGCSGAKSAVVRTSKGPTEMYALESPEIWFEDFGSARLANGRTYVHLDYDFLETVTIDAQNPLKVFIQLTDDCNGVYVRKDITGFEVIELNGGTSSASFDYRVLAKRKGYETQRMKVVEYCYTDRLLYPDDNDPSIPPSWQEQRRKERQAEAKISD